MTVRRTPARDRAQGWQPDTQNAVERRDELDIILSNASGKPIYEQITDQVKEQIMSGALGAGDALPSMRLLAKELDRKSVV